MSDTVFDRDAFAKRCVYDSELQEEIVQGSLPDLEQHIRSVAEAFEHGEAKQLERAAHALKGTSGTLSALDLQAAARQIETDAKEGRLTADSGKRIHGLREQAEALRVRLKELGFPLPEG